MLVSKNTNTEVNLNVSNDIATFDTHIASRVAIWALIGAYYIFVTLAVQLTLPFSFSAFARLQYASGKLDCNSMALL